MSGGESGDEKAYEGDAGEGDEDVAWLDDDGVVLDYEAAGHADDTDVLLDEA